ncbi:hypothetical protein [Jiulongibacter sp. NS-SX5]|uniref:hypothetical protein n=1 Tax=Jiulongibacter sp. NS-SX5 TaxID=3463854 RepID=UPI0040594DCC
MKKLRLKRIAAWLILFSFACGPSPADFEEYFSVFNPITAERPQATDYYFYTNDYLHFGNENPDSQTLADSLNLESWFQFAEQKISKEEFKEGLYSNGTGLKLANKLRSFGFKDAADYVLIAQDIDKETQKFSSNWEPAPMVNDQMLADLRDYVLMNIISTKSDFIKERYTLQAMKIDAKLNDYVGLIDDYNTLNGEYRTKTFISEWIDARLAGAYLHMGDTAKAVLAFANVFEKSPTRRNHADLSVRRLSLENFNQAIELSETQDEKAAVYALQAIQPYQDGLSLMEKIVGINPNHQLLPLIMGREINKNEVGFYADKNAGLYGYEMDIYDLSYRIDSSKVALRKQEALSYFSELLFFAEEQITRSNDEHKPFWHISSAYLNFIAEQYPVAEKHLNEVSGENVSLQRQAEFLKAAILLKTKGLEAEEELLNIATNLKKIKSFRDNNQLVFLANELSQLYTNSEINANPQTGLLSSCKPKKEVFPVSNVKALLAKLIAAEDSEYGGYMNSYHKDGLIYQQDSQMLAKLIQFFTEEKSGTADETLIKLADISLDNLYLAYGRKLIREHDYEKALVAFEKCPESTFNSKAFAEHFEPYPNQYIASRGNEQIDLVAPLDYLEKVVAFQNRAEKNENDAEAWYELGLAAYNFSYWGNAWLFSDRLWSSMEIEYGQPTEEDYFTNTFAKDCFEKALAADPLPELGAQICYMGALCERNQYYIAYTNGKPDTYDENVLSHYRIKMETSVKPTFRSFFKRLKNEFDETVYESQVIKECMNYVNYKLQ